MFHFLFAVIAQAEYLVDICAAVNGRTGHQGEQLPHTGFENFQIGAADKIKLAKQLVQQILRPLFVSVADLLLQPALAVKRIAGRGGLFRQVVHHLEDFRLPAGIHIRCCRSAGQVAADRMHQLVKCARLCGGQTRDAVQRVGIHDIVLKCIFIAV